MQGVAFGLADILDLRLHAFGNIELLTRLPMSIKAGLGQDVINFVIVCLVFFGVSYVISNFMIKKFNIATPGRLGNYIEDEQDNATTDNQPAAEGSTDGASQQVINIVNLLGGKDNIKDVDACMTRLRVTVNDKSKVASDEEWKKEGAMGMVHKDNGVQAIYGPKADVLKSDIIDYLGL